MTITADEPQRPSLEMVRQLTDRRVFEQLLEAETLTRAEIAARTGISKPTISESVRRLIDAGLVGESGRQANARGRAGTYCHVRTDTAAAMAVSVGPDGVVIDTFPAITCARPVCSVSSSSGTRPACDTRLSSSKRAEPAVNLWETLTESASLEPG